MRETFNTDIHLLELQLLTGRTHQIRVHLEFIGLPIIGDQFYGVKNKEFSGQALHAEQLKFKVQSTGQEITIKAPFPEDMLLFIGKQK